MRGNLHDSRELVAHIEDALSELRSRKKKMLTSVAIMRRLRCTTARLLRWTRAVMRLPSTSAGSARALPYPRSQGHEGLSDPMCPRVKRKRYMLGGYGSRLLRKVSPPILFVLVFFVYFNAAASTLPKFHGVCCGHHPHVLFPPRIFYARPRWGYDVAPSSSPYCRHCSVTVVMPSSFAVPCHYPFPL